MGFSNCIPCFIISPITEETTFSKIFPKDSVRLACSSKWSGFLNLTWQQRGIPFFKFPSSLHRKKEGERGMEGKGRRKQGRGKE